MHCVKLYHDGLGNWFVDKTLGLIQCLKGMVLIPEFKLLSRTIFQNKALIAAAAAVMFITPQRTPRWKGALSLGHTNRLYFIHINWFLFNKIFAVKVWNFCLIIMWNSPAALQLELRSPVILLQMWLGA